MKRFIFSMILVFSMGVCIVAEDAQPVNIESIPSEFQGVYTYIGVSKDGGKTWDWQDGSRAQTCELHSNSFVTLNKSLTFTSLATLTVGEKDYILMINGDISVSSICYISGNNYLFQIFNDNKESMRLVLRKDL